MLRWDRTNHLLTLVNLNVTLTYSYTPTNLRESVTDSLGAVGRTTYQYDSAQRLTTITQSSGGTAGARVTLGYNDANWLTSVERSINCGLDRVRSTIAYDSAGRVGTITHADLEYVLVGGSLVVSSNTPLATYVYGYNSGGLLTTENNTEGLATYSYDDTNQLTGADRPVGQTDESYGYDLNGNRNTTGYTISGGNTMTASPGYTYTYDAEGNTSAKTETGTGKVTTYSYDHRNRLTGVTQKSSGGSVIMQATYVYDALSRRIKTDVDADGAGSGGATVTWYVYDGHNTYADFNSGGTLLVRYLFGLGIDELLARTTSGGTTSWYLTDRLGSVRDIANSSGSAIDHISYDAFGQVLSESSPSNGDRFKLTACQYDSGTGLQYDPSRYYDAVIGRWLCQERTPQLADGNSFARQRTNVHRSRLVFGDKDFKPTRPPTDTRPNWYVTGVAINGPGSIRIKPGGLVFATPALPHWWDLQVQLYTPYDVTVHKNTTSWEAMAQKLEGLKDESVTELYLVGHGNGAGCSTTRPDITPAMNNESLKPEVAAIIGRKLVKGGRLVLLSCDTADNTTGMQELADKFDRPVVGNAGRVWNVVDGAGDWVRFDPRRKDK